MIGFAQENNQIIVIKTVNCGGKESSVFIKRAKIPFKLGCESCKKTVETVTSKLQVSKRIVKNITTSADRKKHRFKSLSRTGKKLQPEAYTLDNPGKKQYTIPVKKIIYCAKI